MPGTSPGMTNCGKSVAGGTAHQPCCMPMNFGNAPLIFTVLRCASSVRSSASRLSSRENLGGRISAAIRELLPDRSTTTRNLSAPGRAGRTTVVVQPQRDLSPARRYSAPRTAPDQSSASGISLVSISSSGSAARASMSSLCRRVGASEAAVFTGSRFTLRRRDPLDLDGPFEVARAGEVEGEPACGAIFPGWTRTPSTAGRPSRSRPMLSRSRGWTGFAARRRAVWRPRTPTNPAASGSPRARPRRDAPDFSSSCHALRRH